jgi:hypothetical protein
MGSSWMPWLLIDFVVVIVSIFEIAAASGIELRM